MERPWWSGGAAAAAPRPPRQGEHPQAAPDASARTTRSVICQSFDGALALSDQPGAGGLQLDGGRDVLGGQAGVLGALLLDGGAGLGQLRRWPRRALWPSRPLPRKTPVSVSGAADGPTPHGRARRRLREHPVPDAVHHRSTGRGAPGPRLCFARCRRAGESPVPERGTAARDTATTSPAGNKTRHPG